MSALPRAARYYLIGLWCFALSMVALALLVFPPRPIDLPAIISALIFVVVLTIADLTAFDTEDGSMISIAVALLVAGLTALEWPMLLPVIALGTLSAGLAREQPWWQTLSNIAVRCIAFIPALGIVWLSTQVDGQFSASSDLPYTTLPALISLLLVGTLVYSVERLSEAGLLACSQSRLPRRSWRTVVIYLRRLLRNGRSRRSLGATYQRLWQRLRNAGRRRQPGRQPLDTLRWYTLLLAPLGGLLATLWAISGWAFVLGIAPIVVVQQALAQQAALDRRNREVAELAHASDELNSKLERLLSLATTLVATRDVAEMLRTLCDRMAALLDAHSGWVVLLNDEQVPHLVAWQNLPVELETGQTYQLAWPQSYESVLERQRVTMITDEMRIQTLCPIESLSSRQMWQALIVIPLYVQQQTMGAVCLTFMSIRGLNESEQRILAAFARQASTVLDNARLFREVQDSQTRLIQESKMAALGTFSAGIAHEFNNLLAGMLGYAQLGLTSQDTEVKDESLQVVLDTCKRGKSITGGLLTFSRRREQSYSLNDLHEAVEGTATLMELEFRKHHIRIVREIEPVPPTFCDLGQISQVVLNLMTNARDAMKPDGGTLTVALRQLDSRIEIRVSDTGCGIPDEIRDKIFEPFVTTKGALGGSETPGTGLGLSVSYGIVKEHGGSFDIQSRPGQGTSIIVRLPIVSEPVREAAAEPSPEDLEVPPLRILAVDDEPTVREAIQKQLEQARHEVVVAGDALSALNIYRREMFDLVLSDLAMPGMNGIGLVRAIMALDPEATVLILTGQASDSQIQQALQAGAADVLRKPLEIEQMLQAIKRIWMQRQGMASA